MGKDVQLRVGAKIPPFGSGKDDLDSWSNADMNLLVRILNSYLNCKVEGGTQNQFVISDSNMILQLKSLATGGGTLSVQRYRIKGDDANNPLAGNPVITGTTITCRTWDGTTLGGTDVAVARPNLLRNTITTRTADSITYTYSYTGSAALQRTAHIVTPTSTYDDETQIIVPHYLTGDEIMAISIPTAAGGTGVTNVSWLDLNVEARYWQSSSQAPPP